MNRITGFWKPKVVHPTNQDERSKELGFHTFITQSPGAINTIDIVAIHGLNGHYSKTWTDKRTGVNWLQDLMPCKSARVLSFSYNSTVKYSKSDANIYDFADQLLEGLNASRQSEEEQRRPVIFICHSLGGIVFKQAFIRAHEVERYHSLQRLIFGVIFLGTPHRGSDLASWGSMLSSVLKMGTLGTSTNTQLLKDLETNSRDLDRISKSFIARSKGLKIYSFYETEKLDMMKNLVVSRDSAVLGIPNESVIPMDANHRTICRFTRHDEPRFNPVRSILTELERLASKTPKKEEQNMFIAQLSSTNPKQHKARNPSPVPGTCRWILAHPVYRDWLGGNESLLLWVSADPGCGKSVLASYLIDERMGRDDDITTIICYFFFKSDNHEQRSGVIALQSLLRQLCHQRRELVPTVMRHIEEKHLQSLEALWSAFIATSHEIETKDENRALRVLCILDGLDECDDARKLVKLISTTFSTGGSNGGTLKVLVLSRPNNFIKNAFDKQVCSSDGISSITPTRSAMIRLRGEDQVNSISDDISQVIGFTVSELVRDGLPADFLESVKKELIQRADRTFLWVTLITQLLAAKVETGASRRELDEILKSRDIDAVYSEMLATQANESKARKMLSIILAAAKPLTVAEMSIALAITPDHNPLQSGKFSGYPDSKTFSDLDYDLVRPFETHIKSICGNFVRVIRTKIYLVHETAREFLLKQDHSDEDFEEMDYPEHYCRGLEQSHLERTKSVSGPWQQSFLLPECDAILLHICTTYIYMMAKKCSTANFGYPSQSTYHLLKYAGKFWPEHFGILKEKIDPRNLDYYGNLCHPKFPGFPCWTAAFYGDVRAKEIAARLSVYELEDYYLGLLGILSTPTSDMDLTTTYDESDPVEGEGSERKDMKNRHTARQGSQFRAGTLDRLFSNPGSIGNSYFPTKVDGNGFVSLDFPRKL
ncbi:ankyrin repeat protein [Fusarium avenaceum]|nr:ankyrin repeat protein [Fusarium avenaceum]